MSPANDPKHGRLIQWDAWWLDTLLLAKRLNLRLGKLLDVHGNFRAIKHHDTALTTGTTSHDGQEALLTGKDGIVCQCKPEATTSRRQTMATEAGD